MGGSRASTRGVVVAVESFFVPQRSRPEDELWFFAYRVTIANTGEGRVQLKSRHWIITDGDGEAQEVRGPGVVGEQPTLEPGEVFRYTSACPLHTPVGTMHGSYQMIDADGEAFDADIAPFGLGAPGVVN